MGRGVGTGFSEEKVEKRLLAVILPTLVVGTLAAEEPVQFADATLKATDDAARDGDAIRVYSGTSPETVDLAPLPAWSSPVARTPSRQRSIARAVR
ncbi:MAG TPA: hypothetical protein PKH24_04725 [Sedimentisphaerales bacterium]|nr:hypothetical protein [Sedimentisphaerales bacterium]HNU28715.1 hypothetical protein [Sedimentisphaerales bacterium]